MIMSSIWDLNKLEFGAVSLFFKKYSLRSFKDVTMHYIPTKMIYGSCYEHSKALVNQSGRGMLYPMIWL